VSSPHGITQLQRPYNSKNRSDPASNVTRISRVLRRTCSDGTPQIISYFPGVGTANALDKFTGGAFGMGLDRVARPQIRGHSLLTSILMC